MKNKMDEKPIYYISFEDSNTKGLKGAKYGQTNDKDNTWSTYAYNKGVHTEEDDESLEKSRGGSHGIGKIASNAASELYMMYFANCDEEGNQHLGGTVQLIEHQFRGHYYRSTGYFAKPKEMEDHTTKFYHFENNFDDVFKKDTRGLKIIIPFLGEQFNNEAEIIKSTCDSFFMSILQEKLEVTINDYVITSKTIKEYIKNILDIINEKNLSSVLKAKIKGRPELGRDVRVGRRVIFEFNKSYPIIMSPMLSKEEIEPLFMEYLSYYIEEA